MIPRCILKPKRRQYNSSFRCNHPIGVSYVRISAIKPRKLNHWGTLSPEIRLVNDKIGCSICHNAYSKNNAMSVRSKSGSRLCLACHIKKLEGNAYIQGAIIYFKA